VGVLRALRGGSWRSASICLHISALQREQLLDALVGQGQECVELGARVRGAFSCRLHFHKLPGVGHDNVAIDLRVRIFGVVQVEQWGLVHNADAHRGQPGADGIAAQHLLGAQRGTRAAQRQPRPGDGGRSGAAVSLQHIAVQHHRPLAQRPQIHHRPQRAPDQALDLVRPATHLAGHGLARRTRGARARQHGVLRRQPALAAPFQERGNAILHGGGAQHARLAHLDQDGAFRVPQIIDGESHRAQLIRRASRNTFWHARPLLASASRSQSYHTDGHIQRPDTSRIAAARRASVSVVAAMLVAVIGIGQGGSG
jgi:hypothetical protein